MSAKTLNDRIILLSIIEDFGEDGGPFEKIQFSFERKTGKKINQRYFLRCREEISEMFGIRIGARKISTYYNYYVDYSGRQEQLVNKSSPSCMNAFLLNGVITDDRFVKDRVYICDSFNNDLARRVAQAIIQHKDIKVERVRNEYRAFTDEDGKKVGKVIPVNQKFDFTPYALSFTSQWFMFGKIEGKGSLMVYSLDRIKDVETTFDFGNSPEEFDLNKFLDNFDSELPGGEGFEDDRIIFKRAVGHSMLPNISEAIFKMALKVSERMSREDV